MGDLMRCYVLSGIIRSVIEEIMRRNIKTLEVRSAHNVATALKVNVGDYVFLTPARTYDLDRGVSGLVTEVTGKEVMNQSLFYATTHHIEECEMSVVRLRLQPRGVGRIIRIRIGDLLETLEAEIIEMSHFDAR